MNRIYILFFMLMFSMYSIAQEVITMRNDNGVYTIPCTVNGLKLRFIFDTGAADVSISATEALFMIKNEYLTTNDIVDYQDYTLADGTILENTIININEIKIGSKTLNNVRACVVKNANAPLLLGQSAIKQLGAWYIEDDKLIFGKPSDTASNVLVDEIPIEKCVEEAKKYESYGDYSTAIKLFQKACSVKDYKSYYEFTVFCLKNRRDYTDINKIFPFDYICQAALDGYKPMIDLLKRESTSLNLNSLFRLNKEKALRYYSELIINGKLWFLCREASWFCLFELNNRTKGLEFVMLGVEHNDPESLAYLAHLHSHEYLRDIERNLVSHNKEKGIELYKKVIELGKIEYISTCASLLLEKRDKKENYELAISYLKRAANLGEENAMTMLMEEYFFEEPRNEEKALYWAQKIVENEKAIGYRYAMSIIGTIYFYKEDKAKAFTYLKSAHEDKRQGLFRGNTHHSTILLAECYLMGYGTSKDYSLAYKYYNEYMEDESKINKFDLIFVCNRIAYLYENGLGVSQSSSKAFSYYMKAAQNDDPAAESFVADAYFYGEGITEDINKAIFWYEKSAQQDRAYSCFMLGFIYAREVYGHYNTTKAVECLNKAIECDKEKDISASAYYELGKIYENGGGSISKSYAKAGTYYKKAAELGHDKAKEKMKEFE